jgi:hypothetical protein
MPATKKKPAAKPAGPPLIASSSGAHKPPMDPKKKKQLLVGGTVGAALLVFVLRKKQPAATGDTSGTAGALFDPSAGLAGGGDSGTTVPVTDPLAGIPTDWLTQPSDGGAGSGYQPPSTDPGPSSGPGPGPGPAPPPPAPAPPAAPPPHGAAGFWWGGIWMTSLSQLSAWEKAHGNKTFNVSLWASQHPDAARAVGVTPPPPPPKGTSSQPNHKTSGVAGRSSAPVATRSPAQAVAAVKVGSAVQVKQAVASVQVPTTPVAAQKVKAAIASVKIPSLSSIKLKL